MNRKQSLERLVEEVRNMDIQLRENIGQESVHDETGVCGIEIGDQAAYCAAFEVEIQNRESLGEQSKRIAEALERISTGIYGLCLQCLDEGKPSSHSRIPLTRLKALPLAECCVDHQDAFNVERLSGQSGRSIEWGEQNTEANNSHTMTMEEAAKALG